MEIPIGVCVALRKESVDRNRAVTVPGSQHQQSLSARRAWIEIIQPQHGGVSPTSLSARRAWIEISRWVTSAMPAWSLSARRAWIEIVTESTGKSSSRTSLSARRAWIEMLTYSYLDNADCVALRKESVDRNRIPHGIAVAHIPSLSARRAWIEILLALLYWACVRVALRKESVDRNSFEPVHMAMVNGAWIEIKWSLEQQRHAEVALRKESVDRNLAMEELRRAVWSLSARRAWIEIE